MVILNKLVVVVVVMFNLVPRALFPGFAPPPKPGKSALGTRLCNVINFHDMGFTHMMKSNELSFFLCGHLSVVNTC